MFHIKMYLPLLQKYKKDVYIIYEGILEKNAQIPSYGGDVYADIILSRRDMRNYKKRQGGNTRKETTMKKIPALALSLAMLTSLSVSAFAAEDMPKMSASSRKGHSIDMITPFGL